MRAQRLAALIAAMAILGGAGAAAQQLAHVDPPQVAGTAACWREYENIGVPEHKSEDQELLQRFVCYNRWAGALNTKTRNPDWVIEHLTRARLRDDPAVKRRNNFQADVYFPAESSQHNDYVGSVYERGHQAPAEDFRSSQPATDQSFRMSNMAPQIGPGFNGGQWRILESAVRDWVVCGNHQNIYVITGPIYTRTRYMRDGNVRTNIRVPDAFFKIVYDIRTQRAVGFRLPNARNVPADPVEDFIVPIALIEDETGLDFFPALTRRRQTQLERDNGAPWGHISNC